MPRQNHLLRLTGFYNATQSMLYDMAKIAADKDQPDSVVFVVDSVDTHNALPWLAKLGVTIQNKSIPLSEAVGLAPVFVLVENASEAEKQELRRLQSAVGFRAIYSEIENSRHLSLTLDPG